MLRRTVYPSWDPVSGRESVTKSQHSARELANCMTWLVKKGDPLFMCSHSQDIALTFFFTFVESDSRIFEMVISGYDGELEGSSWYYDQIEGGKNNNYVVRPPLDLLIHCTDLFKAASIRCDFTAFPLVDFEHIKSPGKNYVYYRAPVLLRPTLQRDRLQIEISWKEKMRSYALIDLRSSSPGPDFSIGREIPWTLQL
jgi:hypothetical protein